MKRFKKMWSGNTRKKVYHSMEYTWEALVCVSVAICGGITAVIVIMILVDLIKMGLRAIAG